MGFFTDLKNKNSAKKAGLSYEQYLEYLEISQSREQNDYTLDDYRLHLKAKELNMSDEQYKEYISRFSQMAPDAFLHFCKAREEGLEVKEYDTYLEKYQDKMSAKQYCDYLHTGSKDMSSEEYILYIKEHPDSDKESLELYILNKKAKQLGMTLSQYKEYSFQYAKTMNPKQFLLYCDARAIGLSMVQFKDYCMSYQNNYTLEKYSRLCKAKQAGFTLEQYDEWKSYYSQMTAERFHDLLEARKENISLEAYEEIKKAKALGLTVEQYREKLIADSLGIRLSDLPVYRKYLAEKEQGKGYSVVSSSEDIRLADKAGVEKIILNAEEISDITPYAFENCRFKEIVLPWGIKTIGKHAFRNCVALKSMTIPGSVKAIPRGVFDGCTHLESIEMLSGVEKVDITGWYDLPALKSVASAGSVWNFEIDKTKNYYFYSNTSTFSNDCSYGLTGFTENEATVGLENVRNTVEILEFDKKTKTIWSLENFPKLKVLILSTTFLSEYGLRGIKNCPNLKTIIIHGADQTDYYTKSGSPRKKVEYKKELYLSIEEIAKQIKFFIVESNLYSLSGGLTNKADGIYRDIVYSKLVWLHVPSETTSVSVNAPTLSSIGLSEDCYTKLNNINRILVNNSPFDYKIMPVLAKGASWNNQKTDKVLLYRTDFLLEKNGVGGKSRLRMIRNAINYSVEPKSVTID